MFSGEAAWGCPLSFSLLASFSPSLPLSPSLVLSLTFLFNYLMSPLLAQTPIEMWAAPSALNRLCTSDLWSFLCLTVCMYYVCVSLSVPIMCVSRHNLSVLSVCEYNGFGKHSYNHVCIHLSKYLSYLHQNRRKVDLNYRLLGLIELTTNRKPKPKDNWVTLNEEMTMKEKQHIFTF